jgi:putative transposase
MKENEVLNLLRISGRTLHVYASSWNTGRTAIGHSNGWTQPKDMGKRNNRNFVRLPFNTLINRTACKAEEMGMNAQIQEESHTSKCSFLGSESIAQAQRVAHMGGRIRGTVLRTEDGIPIPIPEASADGTGGIAASTRSFSIPELMWMATSRGVC